jgi:aspartyl-tRNA(Asn)/glutamyl-tRNA(Gln) amidotransferase subunit A
LSDVDAILMPAAPQAAFPYGVVAPVSQADLTALANLSGCPAAVFPHRFGDVKPTASAQLVGSHFSDRRILAISEKLGTLP